jgi:hypothetical protein
MFFKRQLRSGDVVEVKSFDEISQTLDREGALDGVPFMEEMRRFCGRRLRVYKRADKICSERPNFFDLRSMSNAVLLDEVRCDGTAHDGCGRMCMIFWKEAWLKRVPAGTRAEPPIDYKPIVEERRRRFAGTAIDEQKIYHCQSTAVLKATSLLRIWDLRHYARDLRNGALRARDLPIVFFTTLYNRVSGPLGRNAFGMIVGALKRTPAVKLDLRPGELVRIRLKSELETTLDSKGRNRGLGFGGPEMARHCGRTYPVLGTVDRMILEDSGKMRKIENTVLLEGMGCTGLYFNGCARNSHPMWRDAWLERVGSNQGLPETNGETHERK